MNRYPLRILAHLNSLRDKTSSALYIGMFSCVLGVVCFLLLYGYFPLVFSNVNWIYNAGGDALQHYLGWQFFRNGPWRLPLGNIVNLGYPFGINLTYTDSIPLIAIPLKAISPLLKQRFQYIGLWVLINIVLQIFFSILIIRCFTKSLLHQIIGGLLLVLSPIMLIRAWGHSSLSAHWVLLASIYVVLYGRKQLVPIWAWALIFCLSILIHPYLLLMSAIIFIAYLLESFCRDESISHMLLQILAAGLVLLVVGFISGAIEVPFKLAEVWGYGYYSFNLNALFNPLSSTSYFFGPRAITSDFQWEGYNYPGAGYSILILIGSGSLIFSSQRKDWLMRNLPLITVCLLLTIFAITNRISFDSKVLLEVPLPRSLLNSLGIFRSSGRFFWPVLYLVVIFGIVSVIKIKKWSYAVLVVVLLLQLVDLSPMLNERNKFLPNKYQTPLKADFWEEAKSSIKHIELLPATKLMDVYEPLAIYAAKEKMTLNWGYFARGNYTEIYREGIDEVKRLKSGIVSNDTMYVFFDVSLVHVIQKENHNNSIQFYKIDDYIIGLPTANNIVKMLSIENILSEVDPP